MTCKSLYPCGSPFETTKGWEDKIESNFAKAKALLAEAGYDGTPVVLMQSTDIASLSNLAPVAKSLLEKAGFKVDLQAMDWQTLVSRRAKKDPPASGGWSAFLTSWGSVDVLDPGLDQLPQRQLRQGDLRLAVRCRARAAARRLRQGDRPRQAEGDRGGRVRCAPPSTPRTSTLASTCSPRRSARTSRACWSPQRRVLEHREEVT